VNPLSVAPMLHLTSLSLIPLRISALPKEIGNLQKLEKVRLNDCSCLGGKYEPALCSTHATPDVIITGLPNEIGNLQSLTELSCWGCASLKSKWTRSL